ncbi:hypothetical protein KIL84_013646 [Mauremys mutica]|uniref:Uncharacterized protein n=1 Tax=Mauremys mutica TaxID=74926 RepID=A0A9D3WWC0_9SAUR|nr:hypothetical protein KIL84_013646 [Mauremys mutica]
MSGVSAHTAEHRAALLAPRPHAGFGEAPSAIAPAGRECMGSHRPAQLVFCGLEKPLYRGWLLSHSGKAHSSAHTYRLGPQESLMLGAGFVRLWLSRFGGQS